MEPEAGGGACSFSPNSFLQYFSQKAPSVPPWLPSFSCCCYLFPNGPASVCFSFRDFLRGGLESPQV